LSAAELLRTEIIFQRCIDYVDIAGADIVSCVTTAVARLPLR